MSQLAGVQDSVDQPQPSGGTITHRHGSRSIELYHRRWGQTAQHVVETDDLAPIGCGQAGSLGMECRDGGLNRVGAEAARRESSLDESKTFFDQAEIPTGSILIFKEDEIAFR